MEKAIKLSQEEIATAVGMYLESLGTPADIETLEFALKGNGELLATLKGRRVSGPGARFDQVWLGVCSRPNLKDLVTGNVLELGAPSLCLSETEHTIVHPLEWTEELRGQFTFAPGAMEEIRRWLEARTEASAAADILGGDDEGPMDRGAALEEGLGDG